MSRLSPSFPVGLLQSNGIKEVGGVRRPPANLHLHSLRRGEETRSTEHGASHHIGLQRTNLYIFSLDTWRFNEAQGLITNVIKRPRRLFGEVNTTQA
ncbi:hypothetical protein EYF80_004987 [Liparis tanakae]|uniref:Uncharacterized protein n=1 Tax=Liparis tanakae TaxID=230148 RepID=A0A4Z2J618_9TELE|nr:hypothetical protein EYF80_004987 [Liparis tanakae]